MSLNNNLAIIIPAIKIDYFKNTLESLSKQTCKDFVVYVGDDCSGKDFKSLCKEYENDFLIVYKCFDSNLGSFDLVGQWERCIALSSNEEWIWLFSDDDIIGERCVELFYKQINSRKDEYTIYHFDVKIINGNNQIIKEPKRFPDLISSSNFYKKKSIAQLDSFVVEYIFSRSIYEQVNGFEKFDLAWGSDIATWIKMGTQDGIKSISGDFVYWRSSNRNITPNHKKEIVYRKIQIDIDFLGWVNKRFNSRSMVVFNQYVFFRLLFYYSLILDRLQIKNMILLAYDRQIINRFTCRLFLIMSYINPHIKKVKNIYDNTK